MKKQITSALVAGALLTQGAMASVAISFGMGNMYSSTNTATAFPLNGLINLLAITNGSTWATAYPDLISALTTNTASFALPGTTLLGSIANDDSGGPGSTSGVFNFNLTGGVAAGQQLLIVAYPTLTLSSLNPGAGSPGFFFRTDSVIDGSDIAYAIPSDGAGVGLYSYTTDGGGSLPNNQFTSGAGAAGGNGFTTVPEPSTYALLAMGAAGLGGYVIRRRRRE